MKCTGIGHRVLAALVVAAGVGIVWGLLTVWIGTLTDSLWEGGGRVYENVNVARDGTPIIQSYSSANYEIVSYRTLDGLPLSIEREDWLIGASLSELERPPGLYYTPIDWKRRTIAASDHQRPAASWYLIRDDQPHGHGYLAGFDDFSRLPVGFMGREGYRLAVPPQDQWFDLGKNLLNWSRGPVCSSGYLNYGGRAYSYSSPADEQRLPEWFLFLLDGDRLLEIDLRSHSIRTVHESPELISVGILAEIQPDESVSPKEPEAPTEGSAGSGWDGVPVRPVAYAAQSGTFDIIVPNPATAVFRATPPASSSKVKTQNRVALRSMDRITILDPPTGTKREFPLPKQWQDKSLDVYALSAEQLLLVHQDWTTRWDAHFVWLGADGQITHEQTETLAGYQPENRRTSALLLAGAAPVPVGWVLGVGVVGPLGLVQANNEPTYLAGLAETVDACWPALLILSLVGIVLAWVAWRWQRKYHRPATGVWVAFVFLLGVPGFVAYWLEHRRVKLGTCGECGAPVPRDRDACAACSSPFPAPLLVGTEIFA